MNYKQIYINLINKCKKKNGIVNYRNSPTLVGLLRHHINYEHLPYFIKDLEDPINDCVYMTKKEHALAHILIAKAYPNIPGKHLIAGYLQSFLFTKVKLFSSIVLKHTTEYLVVRNKTWLAKFNSERYSTDIRWQKQVKSLAKLEKRLLAVANANRIKNTLPYMREVSKREMIRKNQDPEFIKKRDAHKYRSFRWYNNGIKSITVFENQEVPEGFVPGRYITPALKAVYNIRDKKVG